MTDKEIRLQCFKLSLEYITENKPSLENMFETAEKIYEFVRKDDDAIGQNDEVDWDAYQEKLRENNRRVKIRL